MRHLKQTAFACAAILMTAGTSAAIAQGQPPVKIGFPVFLSGPAVGAFGEPSRNAAQLIVRAMNDGEIPAPYNQKGLGGIPIEPKIIDEAGNTATVGHRIQEPRPARQGRRGGRLCVVGKLPGRRAGRGRS